MRPDTAAQLIGDELMLDGNARLNLATFVTTWMEPQARELMASTFDKNMIDKDEYPRTAEHRDALRQHPQPALELARPRGGHGHFHDGFERGRDARGHGAEVAVARPDRARRASRSTSPNMVMGANVQVCWEKFAALLGRRGAARADGGRALQPDRRRGREVLRREHHRRRRRARLDLRRQLRARPGDLRGARQSCRPTPASTCRFTSTARPAASSRRSSTPSSSGTSGCRASSRSTRPGTSTASCTPASAGRSGATRRRCPTTSCST